MAGMVLDCKKKSNFALVEVRTIIKKGREKKVWYAIRVTYHRELKVKEDLDARGITSFVPMQYRREERNGVMVKRLVPSVHNLIFIHTTPSEMVEYKKTTNLPIRYIMNRETHKPVTVPTHEMENFIRVAGTYDEKLIYLNPDPGDFTKGERVRIVRLDSIIVTVERVAEA
jgi:transcription antitermination factor NusG